MSSTVTQIHESHWRNFLDDQLHAALYESWWHKDRINYWRHTRLLAPALEILGSFGKRTWLTVGDGAGTDAWRLIDAGLGEVLATDLDDTMLAKTKAAGFINNYQVANAEKLPFPDNSFDFVLCKETLHHMERPYLGLYECLRVCRYAVAVIEPQDPYIDVPQRTDVFQPGYERVGNFVYCFSEHEINKLGLGLNLLGTATKHMSDVYIPGCEFKTCSNEEPMWKDILLQLANIENQTKAGFIKPNYIQAVLFKETVSPEVFDFLRTANNSWKFSNTNLNPYIANINNQKQPSSLK